MAYKFEAKPYFQPAHFGPWPVEPVLHYGDLTGMAIYYVTDKDALGSMLPPGFEVPDVPTVNVWAQYCRDVSFMAGFGYNIVGVNFSAIWKGKKETRTGELSAVLWENDFLPIMFGREHLGAPKLWADIPDVQTIKGNGRRFVCSEKGSMLVEGFLTDLIPLPADTLAMMDADSKNANWFCWKYISHASQKKADLNLPTSLHYRSKLKEAWSAKGTHKFHTPKWEEAPLSSHIMAGLSKLQVKEYMGAIITRGETDLLFGEIDYLE